MDLGKEIEKWEALLASQGLSMNRGRLDWKTVKKIKTHHVEVEKYFELATDYLWNADWTGREQDKEIWFAHAVDGLSERETMKVLGLSRHTVVKSLKASKEAAGLTGYRVS